MSEVQPPATGHTVSLDEIRIHPQLLSKARGYLLARKVRRDGPGVWIVQGVAELPYIVRTDADAHAGTVSWIACDCGHRANSQEWSRCAHAVVVLVVVRDGIQVPYAVGDIGAS